MESLTDSAARAGLRERERNKTMKEINKNVKESNKNECDVCGGNKNVIILRNKGKICVPCRRRLADFSNLQVLADTK